MPRIRPSSRGRSLAGNPPSFSVAGAMRRRLHALAGLQVHRQLQVATGVAIQARVEFAAVVDVADVVAHLRLAHFLDGAATLDVSLDGHALDAGHGRAAGTDVA